MTKNQIEPAGRIREPSRLRYLIDIVVLVAVTFLLDAVLGAFIHVPIDWRKGFVFDAMGKMLLVGVAWGVDQVARRDVGRHRAQAACELGADIHHRYRASRNCLHRHVSFGKGGVSPRSEQVQGCARKSGTRSSWRFLCTYRRGFL